MTTPVLRRRRGRSRPPTPAAVDVARAGHGAVARSPRASSSRAGSPPPSRSSASSRRSLDRDWLAPSLIPGMTRGGRARRRRGARRASASSCSATSTSTASRRALWPLAGSRAMGATVSAIVPHRFSEGYGLSAAAIDRVLAARARPRGHGRLRHLRRGRGRRCSPSTASTSSSPTITSPATCVPVGRPGRRPEARRRELPVVRPLRRRRRAQARAGRRRAARLPGRRGAISPTSRRSARSPTSSR